MFSIERVAPINNVKFLITCDTRHEGSFTNKTQKRTTALNQQR
jgi:hypothetical protein